MPANIETEQSEVSQIIEHPDEFPETLVQSTGAQPVAKNFTSQISDDNGAPIIQTPPTQIITVSPPSDTATLTTQAKGSTTSSATWLAAFWLRVIKKAMHFGWQVITGNNV